jgi:hypothetical protein
VLHALFIHLLSFLFLAAKAISFPLLVQLWLIYSRAFLIFLLLLLLRTLYPRSNQDVSAGVLGYLLTVLFEKKSAEPKLSILCLSLQSHRGLFVSSSYLTRSEVLVSGAL